MTEYVRKNGGPHRTGEEIDLFVKGKLRGKQRKEFIVHLAEYQACQKKLVRLTKKWSRED